MRKTLLPFGVLLVTWPPCSAELFKRRPWTEVEHTPCWAPIKIHRKTTDHRISVNHEGHTCCHRCPGSGCWMDIWSCTSWSEWISWCSSMLKRSSANVGCHPVQILSKPSDVEVWHFSFSKLDFVSSLCLTFSFPSRKMDWPFHWKPSGGFMSSQRAALWQDKSMHKPGQVLCPSVPTPCSRRSSCPSVGREEGLHLLPDLVRLFKKSLKFYMYEGTGDFTVYFCVFQLWYPWTSVTSVPLQLVLAAKYVSNWGMF